MNAFVSIEPHKKKRELTVQSCKASCRRFDGKGSRSRSRKHHVVRSRQPPWVLPDSDDWGTVVLLLFAVGLEERVV